MKGMVYTLHAHGVRQQAARGGRVRRLPVLGRFALVVLFTLAMLLQPYTIGLSDTGQGVRLQAHHETAHAAPAAMPYAFAFMSKLAEQCDMTPYDFCTTICIMLAAATGYNPVVSNTVYGAAGNAIPALKATGVWPSWEDLSVSEQSEWGGVDNYHAAQLLETIGQVEIVDSNGDYVSFIEDEAQRYYDHMEQNAGDANGFEFGQNVASFVSSAFGSVGQAWMLGEKVGTQALNIFNNMASVLSAYGVHQRAYLENVLPFEIEYINGYGAYYQRKYNSRYTNETFLADSSVYFFGAYFPNNNVQVIGSCSKSEYSYGTKTSYGIDATLPDYNITIDKSSEQVNNFDENYSYKRVGSYANRALLTNVPNQTISSEYTSNYWSNPSFEYRAAYVVLFGNKYWSNMDGGPNQLDDITYPDDGVGATGLNPDTPWDDLFGAISSLLPRPDNNYNPDNQTGTNEWRDETTANVLPLANIKFDKLFPFSMVSSVPRLMDKITSWSDSQYVNYQNVIIPVEAGEISSEIELDFSDLAVLLVMVRPFLQALLVFGLLWSVIQFWRGILTGS